MATDGPERFRRSMERSTGDGFPSFFLTKDMTMTRRMDEMTHDELKHYMRGLMSLLSTLITPDTTGFMLVMYTENSQCQYGGTIDRSDAPAALRELADRLEDSNPARKAHLN